MNLLQVIEGLPGLVRAEAMPGYHIDDVCLAAVQLAKDKNCAVSFEFNAVQLVATKNSFAERLSDEFWRKVDQRDMNRQQQEHGVFILSGTR